MSDALVLPDDALTVASSKGFWKQKNGDFWYGDAPYVRPDGIIPKECPELNIRAMELHLKAGSLDNVEWLLNSKATASIEAMENPAWRKRIALIRSEVAQLRAAD